MARKRKLPRQAGSAAKTATSKARSAVSGRFVSKGSAKRASSGAGLQHATFKKLPTGKKPLIVKVGGVGSAASITGSGTHPAIRGRTPVQEAASNLRLVDTGEALEADDVTVLQVARAVAEHRRGLMDRLAK